MFKKMTIAFFVLILSISAVANSHDNEALLYIENTESELFFNKNREQVLFKLTSPLEELLLLPQIKSNPEAIKATKEFVLEMKVVINDTYEWKTIENKYVQVLKEIYSEEDLIKINNGYVTHMDQEYLAKHSELEARFAEITKHIDQVFMQRTVVVEDKYQEQIRKALPDLY